MLDRTLDFTRSEYTHQPSCCDVSEQSMLACRGSKQARPQKLAQITPSLLLLFCFFIIIINFYLENQYVMVKKKYHQNIILVNFCGWTHLGTLAYVDSLTPPYMWPVRTPGRPEGLHELLKCLLSVHSAISLDVDIASTDCT